MSKNRPTEFETAAALYKAAAAANRELIDRCEGMKLALSLSVSGDNPRTPQALHDKAEPYIALARKRRAKLQNMLADAEDARNANQPHIAAASDAWQAAQRQETNRLAEAIQPRQRKAAIQMAEAIEKLSIAMAEERACREKLKATAPLPTSPWLPNLSDNLLIGSFGDFESPAWFFRRKLHDLEILK